MKEDDDSSVVGEAGSPVGVELDNMQYTDRDTPGVDIYGSRGIQVTRRYTKLAFSEMISLFTTSITTSLRTWIGSRAMSGV